MAGRVEAFNRRPHEALSSPLTAPRGRPARASHSTRDGVSRRQQVKRQRPATAALGGATKLPQTGQPPRTWARAPHFSTAVLPQISHPAALCGHRFVLVLRYDSGGNPLESARRTARAARCRRARPRRRSDLATACSCRNLVGVERGEIPHQVPQPPRCHFVPCNSGRCWPLVSAPGRYWPPGPSLPCPLLAAIGIDWPLLA